MGQFADLVADLGPAAGPGVPGQDAEIDLYWDTTAEQAHLFSRRGGKHLPVGRMIARQLQGHPDRLAGFNLGLRETEDSILYLEPGLLVASDFRPVKGREALEEGLKQTARRAVEHIVSYWEMVEPRVSFAIDHIPGQAPGQAPEKGKQDGKKASRDDLEHLGLHDLQPARQAMKAQLAAMGASAYQVRAIHPSRPARVRTGTMQQLIHDQAGTLMRLNRQGYDIYVRPFPDNQGIVVIDDLDRAGIDVLAKEGLRIAASLETSPGNYQAWVGLPEEALPGDQESREKGQNERAGAGTGRGQSFDRYLESAIQRLATLAAGGDRHAVGHSRIGRLAGFANNKPARRLPDGSAPLVRIDASSTEARAIEASKDREAAGPEPEGTGAGAAHLQRARDFAGRAAVLAELIHRDSQLEDTIPSPYQEGRESPVLARLPGEDGQPGETVSEEQIHALWAVHSLALSRLPGGNLAAAKREPVPVITTHEGKRLDHGAFDTSRVDWRLALQVANRYAAAGADAATIQSQVAAWLSSTPAIRQRRKGRLQPYLMATARKATARALGLQDRLMERIASAPVLSGPLADAERGPVFSLDMNAGWPDLPPYPFRPDHLHDPLDQRWRLSPLSGDFAEYTHDQVTSSRRMDEAESFMRAFRDRWMPYCDVRATGFIVQRGEGGAWQPVPRDPFDSGLTESAFFFDPVTAAPTLLLSTHSRRPLEALHHEAVHGAINTGRLSAGDRQLLLEGPINDYWREKIGIDQLYPDLSEERKREEVAADVYAGQLLGYSPRREAWPYTTWPVHDEPGPSGGPAGSLLGRVRHFVGRHPEELKPAAAEAASLYSLIASGDYLERGILDPVYAAGIAAATVGIGPDHPHRFTIYRDKAPGVGAPGGGAPQDGPRFSLQGEERRAEVSAPSLYSASRRRAVLELLNGAGIAVDTRLRKDGNREFVLRIGDSIAATVPEFETLERLASRLPGTNPAELNPGAQSGPAGPAFALDTDDPDKSGHQAEAISGADTSGAALGAAFGLMAGSLRRERDRLLPLAWNTGAGGGEIIEFLTEIWFDRPEMHRIVRNLAGDIVSMLQRKQAEKQGPTTSSQKEKVAAKRAPEIPQPVREAFDESVGLLERDLGKDIGIVPDDLAGLPSLGLLTAQLADYNDLADLVISAGRSGFSPWSEEKGPDDSRSEERAGPGQPLFALADAVVLPEGAPNSVRKDGWLPEHIVLRGDIIRHREAVWGGPYSKPERLGDRTIVSRVLNESYSRAGQHSFTIQVIGSAGEDPLPVGQITRRKGRNIYRNGVERQLWEDESRRASILAEKRERGEAARAARRSSGPVYSLNDKSAPQSPDKGHTQQPAASSPASMEVMAMYETEQLNRLFSFEADYSFPYAGGEMRVVETYPNDEVLVETPPAQSRYVENAANVRTLQELSAAPPLQGEDRAVEWADHLRQDWLTEVNQNLLSMYRSLPPYIQARPAGAEAALVAALHGEKLGMLKSDIDAGSWIENRHRGVASWLGDTTAALKEKDPSLSLKFYAPRNGPAEGPIFALDQDIPGLPEEALTATRERTGFILEHIRDGSDEGMMGPAGLVEAGRQAWLGQEGRGFVLAALRESGQDGLSLMLVDWRQGRVLADIGQDGFLADEQILAPARAIQPVPDAIILDDAGSYAVPLTGLQMNAIINRLDDRQLDVAGQGWNVIVQAILSQGLAGAQGLAGESAGQDQAQEQDGQTQAGETAAAEGGLPWRDIGIAGAGAVAGAAAALSAQANGSQQVATGTEAGADGPAGALPDAASVAPEPVTLSPFMEQLKSLLGAGEDDPAHLDQIDRLFAAFRNSDGLPLTDISELAGRLGGWAMDHAPLLTDKASALWGGPLFSLGNEEIEAPVRAVLIADAAGQTLSRQNPASEELRFRLDMIGNDTGDEAVPRASLIAMAPAFALDSSRTVPEPGQAMADVIRVDFTRKGMVELLEKADPETGAESNPGSSWWRRRLRDIDSSAAGALLMIGSLLGSRLGSRLRAATRKEGALARDALQPAPARSHLLSLASENALDVTASALSLDQLRRADVGFRKALLRAGQKTGLAPRLEDVRLRIEATLRGDSVELADMAIREGAFGADAMLIRDRDGTHRLLMGFASPEKAREAIDILTDESRAGPWTPPGGIRLETAISLTAGEADRFGRLLGEDPAILGRRSGLDLRVAPLDHQEKHRDAAQAGKSRFPSGAVVGGVAGAALTAAGAMLVQRASLDHERQIDQAFSQVGAGFRSFHELAVALRDETQAYNRSLDEGIEAAGVALLERTRDLRDWLAEGPTGADPFNVTSFLAPETRQLLSQQLENVEAAVAASRSAPVVTAESIGEFVKAMDQDAQSLLDNAMEAEGLAAIPGYLDRMAEIPDRLADTAAGAIIAVTEMAGQAGEMLHSVASQPLFSLSEPGSRSPGHKPDSPAQADNQTRPQKKDLSPTPPLLVPPVPVRDSKSRKAAGDKTAPKAGPEAWLGGPQGALVEGAASAAPQVAATDSPAPPVTAPDAPADAPARAAPGRAPAPASGAQAASRVHRPLSVDPANSEALGKASTLLTAISDRDIGSYVTTTLMAIEEAEADRRAGRFGPRDRLRHEALAAGLRLLRAEETRRGMTPTSLAPLPDNQAIEGPAPRRRAQMER